MGVCRKRRTSNERDRVVGKKIKIAITYLASYKSDDEAARHICSVISSSLVTGEKGTYVKRPGRP